jgi:hypothetical protein
MVSDNTKDTLYCVSNLDRSKVFVNKAAWGNEGKVLNSWGHWKLNGALVEGLHADNGKLLVAVTRGDSLFLEQVETTDVGLLMDRRVKSTGIFDGTYTVFATPYTVDDSVSYSGVVEGDNTVLDLEVNSSTSLRALGNHAGIADVGVDYSMSYTFSPVYRRDNNGRPLLDNKLKMRTFGVNTDGDVGLELHVQPKYREVRINRFGYDSNRRDGFTRLMVQSEASTVRLALVNSSPYQAGIYSAIWEAELVKRTNRSV